MISYAALGVNQLGAVYENLMSYRGYYAEEDLITVHKKGEKDNSDNCLLDRYSRMGEYDLKNEVVHEPDNSEAPARIPRGSFVYWLSSLDRSRTASFYTPESLTQSTVKFILQGFEERLRTGEMMYPELLDLRILDADVGTAAMIGVAALKAGGADFHLYGVGAGDLPVFP